MSSTLARLRRIMTGIALGIALSGSLMAADAKPPMVRIAELEIKPAMLESYKAAVREEIETSIKTEPGVLAIYAVGEKDSPHMLRFMEIYADEAAYNSHIASLHFQKYLTVTKDMIVSKTLIDTVPVQLSAKTQLVTQTQKAEKMKITLTAGNKVVTATLDNTPTTQAFIAQLPLTLTFEDYAQAEKISYLPKKLTTEGAPEGADASIGDISYYAPWGNLAIFYKGAPYGKGLVKLGRIDSGMDALLMSVKFPVTIKLAQ